MKREIALLTGEKGLKDLNRTTNVCRVDIHSLKSLPKGAFQLNARERLNVTFLNAISIQLMISKSNCDQLAYNGSRSGGGSSMR